MAVERVAVVTGASSGIGKEAAKALAAQGWRVIAIGRDPGRCAAAAQELRAAGGKTEMIVANLALLSEAARIAREIEARTDRVDVLINNAGGMSKEKVITSEGLEENFAGNHLGPFVLTNKLLPLLLRAAADAPKGAVRIINTSSDASEMIPGMDLGDMQAIESWSSGGAYCRGKLANVLHARALAKRLASDGVIAHAVHPGTIASNFASHATEQTQAYMATLKTMSSEEGAVALVWLATGAEPGQSSGGYYHQRAPHAPNAVVDDEAYVSRFWDESEKLAARVPI